MLQRIGKGDLYTPVSRSYVNLREEWQEIKKNVYVWDFSDSSVIYLAPLGDIHYGLRASNRAMFERYLDFILNTPDCYTIFLGDQAENATRDSVGFGMFEENVHLPDQIDYLAEVLEPLAEAKKILGIQDGNHEYRSTAKLGIRPMRLVAQRLSIPYLGFQGYLRVLVGGQKYDIMTAHGRGGGRTTAGKVRAAEIPAEVTECDIYLTGHNHMPGYHRKSRFEIDSNNNLARRDRHFVYCGALVDYWDTYAEKEMLPPSSFGMPLITLYGDVHRVGVEF